MLVVKARVHSMNAVPVAAEVDFQGHQVKAMVDCLEVELFTEGSHGNVTLRFMGVDANHAKEFLKPDDVITLQLIKE